MTRLRKLFLNGTQVSDLSPLAELKDELKALRALYCSRTNVRDVSPLAELTRLGTLDLSATLVSDLSPLAGLTELGLLRVDQGVDTGPVKHIEGLKISRARR